MTPEQLVEKLKQANPTGLKSVILYGSAAAGDYAGKRSDYNVLVVMDRLGLPELKLFLQPSRAWIKAGNAPPLLFTPDGLRQSVDVFPIELLDIRDSHLILYGEDMTRDIQVEPRNLRLQLEHELKGKVIQLRERYLETGGKPAQVGDLLMSSLSSFLVLFRAALRLFQDQVPATKIEAVKQLSSHISFDTEVFETVDALKAGTKKLRELDTEELFGRYLQTVETIVQAVDAHLCKP
ncbi:MAG: nucleotidyltransferase domain-containing protein [Acidobacteria bacterium]|nr:MAG: nucleotidyltransferase domain-containing protein [Acidobacteriota bacterium]